MNVQYIEIWMKLAIEVYLMSAEKVNNAKAKKDPIICNNANGSSNDIHVIDSNSDGLNLANKYANARPKSSGRFLSYGNGDINAIKLNPYKMQRSSTNESTRIQTR